MNGGIEGAGRTAGVFMEREIHFEAVDEMMVRPGGSPGGMRTRDE